MVLETIDVNKKTESKQHSGPTKAARKNESTKEAFNRVCSSRVGELLDSDELPCLKIWSFDDFIFVKKLGNGGTACVYLAREKQSGHEVALKIQPEDENAICELDLHESFKHPNVVNLIDYFFSEEKFMIDDDDDKDAADEGLVACARNLIMILEVCDCGSLFDVIRDSPNGHLQEDQAALFFLGAVNALEYIHKQDVIHCDIKSLNFLIHGGKALKICDFGMSVRCVKIMFSV